LDKETHMSTVLEPLGDQVLVKQSDAQDQSPGGIIIPTQAKDPPKEAKVIAVGPGKRLETGDIIPMQVAVGDLIVFAHYAGQAVEVDEEELLLLRHEDILAKVRREE
jgi:chaperonin GroES